MKCHVLTSRMLKLVIGELHASLTLKMLLILMCCVLAKEVGKARFVGMGISCCVHPQHYVVCDTVHAATRQCNSA